MPVERRNVVRCAPFAFPGRAPATAKHREASRRLALGGADTAVRHSGRYPLSTLSRPSFTLRIIGGVPSTAARVAAAAAAAPAAPCTIAVAALAVDALLKSAACAA
jgi:hypothetical protein